MSDHHEMQTNQLIERVVRGVGEQTEALFQAWYTDNVDPVLATQQDQITELSQRMIHLIAALEARVAALEAGDYTGPLT